MLVVLARKPRCAGLLAWPKEAASAAEPEPAPPAERAGAHSLSDDLMLLVLARLAAGSFADVAAVLCTCRRFAQLVRGNALPLVAPLAGAISAARCASAAALEAEGSPRAAALGAIAAALAARRAGATAETWVRGLQLGPCRVCDGSWCSHGLCMAADFGPRPKPGVAALLEAAAADGGTGKAADAVGRTLATVLEAVGAPRLALLGWMELAEPPSSCPRAQLRVALHYHSGLQTARELVGARRAPKADRGCAARAHAAVGAFSKVMANERARDDEAALAGTYLGFMHLDALGVPQNDGAARRCFALAAQRGGDDAADMLRELEAERGWPPVTRASGPGSSARQAGEYDVL